MVVRLVHPLNTLCAMLVGLPVNVIDVKPIQLKNALDSMLVNPLGNEVRANLVHSKNAL